MDLSALTFDQTKELLTLAAQARQAAPATVAAPAADRSKAVAPLSESDRERMASVSLTGKTKGKEAKEFDAWLHRGGAIPREKATMVEGTDANGGYAVPVEYSNEIVTALREQSIMRRAGARIMTITGTDSFRVPGMTDSAAATLGAEASAYGTSEPTLSEIEFKPYKYKKMSKVSEELVEDSRFDVWGNILQGDYIQAFDAAENAAFATGTGTAQPQGVVTGASAGITAASATAVTGDELINLFHSLDYKYRMNASWMFNDTIALAIRKLKDSDGQYLWRAGLEAGEPDTLLGRPVITNNSMAGTIAASAVTALFGDFRYFWIADFNGGGLAVQRLNELFAGDGLIGFRAYKRIDSHVMLSAAIKKLTQAAA